MTTTLSIEQIRELFEQSAGALPAAAIKESLRIEHSVAQEFILDIADDSGNPETLAIIEQESLLIRVTRTVKR